MKNIKKIIGTYGNIIVGISNDNKFVVYANLVGTYLGFTYERPIFEIERINPNTKIEVEEVVVQENTTKTIINSNGVTFSSKPLIKETYYNFTIGEHEYRSAVHITRRKSAVRFDVSYCGGYNMDFYHSYLIIYENYCSNIFVLDKLDDPRYVQKKFENELYTTLLPNGKGKLSAFSNMIFEFVWNFIESDGYALCLNMNYELENLITEIVKTNYPLMSTGINKVIFKMIYNHNLSIYDIMDIINYCNDHEQRISMLFIEDIEWLKSNVYTGSNELYKKIRLYDELSELAHKLNIPVCITSQMNSIISECDEMWEPKGIWRVYW